MNVEKSVSRFPPTLDSVEEALSQCLYYIRKGYENSSQELK